MFSKKCFAQDLGIMLSIQEVANENTFIQGQNAQYETSSYTR